VLEKLNPHHDALVAEAEFDEVAANYRQTLDQAISISGEDGRYFANQRVAWLRSLLDHRGFTCESIMDFGCGTGLGIEFLQESFHPSSITGIDVSSESLKIAEKTYPEPSIEFYHPDHYRSTGKFDLVHANGVFHHIDEKDRQEAILYIQQSLRPGGYCAIWENNPWSLPARYCMKVNPFDQNAKMITARQLRTLCQAAGLQTISTYYCFVFPRVFSPLRRFEKYINRMPLGAQYLVLSHRPT